MSYHDFVVPKEMANNLSLLKELLSSTTLLNHIQEQLEITDHRIYTPEELLRGVRTGVKTYLKSENMDHGQIASYICCNIDTDEDTIDVYEDDDEEGAQWFFIVLRFHWLNQWMVIRWEVEFHLRWVGPQQDQYKILDITIHEAYLRRVTL